MSHSNRSTLGYVALVITFIAACFGPAHAQTERIEVHSTTLTDTQVLTGSKEGKAVTLAGELRIPRTGTDRLPAVILLHGSGGISGREDGWSRQFNTIGVATFILNSFTGRGLVSTVADQDQLGRLAMTIDAYRALERLAKHPRIDPARIAVMGFSRGGQAALYSSLKRLYRMHGPASGLEFAAYITLYANCGTTYVDDHDVADRPIRMFHGTADDYVPVAPCRAYVERLRAKGKDVLLTEYADARHVFDNPALQTPVRVAHAQTTRGCRLEEGPDGRIINSQTKQPFSNAGDPCVEKGVTIAYNADAHAQALIAVKEFVVTTLKPQ
jgi:dienelactone hydrolase